MITHVMSKKAVHEFTGCILVKIQSPGLSKCSTATHCALTGLRIPNDFQMTQMTTKKEAGKQEISVKCSGIKH